MALIAVPVLTFALPRFGVPAEVAPLTAVATSMAVVAVTAVASAMAHQRLGNVDWWLAKAAIPFGLVGMLTGSLLAPHLPSTMLRLIFAAFLMYVPPSRGDRDGLRRLAASRCRHPAIAWRVDSSGWLAASSAPAVIRATGEEVARW